MSIPSLSCTASIVLPGIGHLMISFHLSFPSYQTSSLQHCYGFPGLLSNGSCFGRCRFLCNTVVGNRKGWKSRTLPENGLFAALKFYDVEKKKIVFIILFPPKMWMSCLRWTKDACFCWCVGQTFPKQLKHTAPMEGGWGPTIPITSQSDAPWP